MLIFIDDSGDPGFRVGSGSSEIFVIALVIFTDPLVAEETSLEIKKLRRKLGLADTYEFKFNKSGKKFKPPFFDTVKQYDFKVRAIVVRKENIYSHALKSKKERFYNYIIMQVFRKSSTIKNAKLWFDKYGERAIRDELRVYLSRELNNKDKQVFKDLKFADSRRNTLIQLADMVAGSIFAAYSGKDECYLKKLKQAGRIEDIWAFR
jgi:hypothetical protein